MIAPAVPIPGPGGIFQLVLAGKIYAAATTELAARIKDAVDAGAAHLVLDCAAVEQMDSLAFYTVIAGFKQLSRKNRGRIVFAAIKPKLDRVLTLTHMNKLFTVAASVDEAVAMLRAGKSGPPDKRRGARRAQRSDRREQRGDRRLPPPANPPRSGA